MKSKLLIYILIISIGISIASTNAQMTTNMLFNYSNELFAGYYAVYPRDILHSDTIIRVDLNASVPISFGICDENKMDNWQQHGGSEPYWYVLQNDVTIDTISVNVNRGTYDFVLINYGSINCAYNITVYESYDTSSSFGNNIYTIIGIVIAIFVIIGITAFIRSRRRRVEPTHYQTQAQIHQTFTPQQPTEYKPLTDEQTVFNTKPKGLQVCPNCGADEEISTQFCTNCGSKLK